MTERELPDDPNLRLMVQSYPSPAEIKEAFFTIYPGLAIGVQNYAAYYGGSFAARPAALIAFWLSGFIVATDEELVNPLLAWESLMAKDTLGKTR